MLLSLKKNGGDGWDRTTDLRVMNTEKTISNSLKLPLIKRIT
jgi:hypothetical protein